MRYSTYAPFRQVFHDTYIHEFIHRSISWIMLGNLLPCAKFAYLCQMMSSRENVLASFRSIIELVDKYVFLYLHKITLKLCKTVNLFQLC